MLNWWKKQVRCTGAVLFRGSLPPTAQDMAPLRSLGFELVEKPSGANCHWTLEARSTSGSAHLLALRDPPRLTRGLVDWSVDLTREEREEAVSGQATIAVTVSGARDDLLRDRKTLLRILGAIMGRDGTIAVDNTSQKFWSRAALDDELSHDADVDIQALYNLHAVGDEGRLAWLHTHGLAEIGMFDFDLIYPHETFVEFQSDGVRLLTLAIAEGRLTRGGPAVQLGDRLLVQAIEAATFDARAHPADRAARSLIEDHLADRVVICEPAGWLSRLRGRPVVPSRFYQSEPPDGCVFGFSTEAGRLMSARARGSLATFRRLFDEFAEFQLPALAKLAYRTDGGASDSLEHMWFEVHQIGDETVDATLAVRPIGISRMKEGDRAQHSLEHLTDWLIITPAGNITPRTTTAARRLRPHKDELRRALAESKQQ